MTARSKPLTPDMAIILERSRSVFSAQWDELLRLRRIVLETSGPDDIHDLRVASRRFRAALALFYRFVPKSSKLELKKGVRTLTRVLGGLRNIDEAILFFQSHPCSGVSNDGKLCRIISGLRADELKRIHKTLKAFNHKKMCRIVRDTDAGLNEEAFAGRKSISLIPYFTEISVNLCRQIRQVLEVAKLPEQRSSRHALRIAIKKWRYFLEIVAPILEQDYSSTLELLKEYQTVLGKMNDLAEFEKLFSRLDLPAVERKYVASTLQSEDSCLLKNLTKLIDHKPIVCSELLPDGKKYPGLVKSESKRRSMTAAGLVKNG